MAYLNRGNAYLDKGELDHAIADYDKAIEIDPNFEKALENRDLIYKAKDRIEGWTIGIKSNSRPDYYNYRGETYSALGKYTQAIADYTKAIELEPDRRQKGFYYKNRCWAYIRKREYNFAIADCTKAIELSSSVGPDSTASLVEAYRHRANAYEKKGNVVRAKADREKANQLENPQSKSIQSPPPPPPIPASPINKGLVNGSAILLSRPPYPAEARAEKIGGEVQVRVLIDEKVM